MVKMSDIMGVGESDVVSFIQCLQIWTDRGYSLDEAIGKHMEQMGRFINKAANMPYARELVVLLVGRD